MPYPSTQALAVMALWLASTVQPAAAEELAGTLMQPSQTAPIRATPPSGFWRTPGDKIGETNIGTEYFILEQFDVQSGLGASQTWVQVAPVDPATGAVDPNDAGWVYFGESAATRSLNFDPRSAPATRSMTVEPEAGATAGPAPTATRSIIILSPEGN